MHKDYPTLHKYDILLKSFGVHRFFVFWSFFLKTKTNKNKQKQTNKQTNKPDDGEEEAEEDDQLEEKIEREEWIVPGCR